MQTIRRAVIDIGTNSVKLLVADVDGGTVQPVLEESEQTRLGAGFFETNRLQPPAIALTARAVASFAEVARKLGAVFTRVIATSAAREAVNPGDLTSAVEHACALKVEIISGGQEADWAFRGVNTEPELARHPLLLLDVGGGSTEFILGRGGRKYFSQSYRLGTVRFLEHRPPGDPPAVGELAGARQWVSDFLNREVRPELEPVLRGEPGLAVGEGCLQLVGTGGTAAILGRIEGGISTFDRRRIEGVRLSRAQVRGPSGVFMESATGSAGNHSRPASAARGCHPARSVDLRRGDGGLPARGTVYQHPGPALRRGERIDSIAAGSVTQSSSNSSREWASESAMESAAERMKPRVFWWA